MTFKILPQVEQDKENKIFTNTDSKVHFTSVAARGAEVHSIFVPRKRPVMIVDVITAYDNFTIV
jgi:hypothetical protein